MDYQNFLGDNCTYFKTEYDPPITLRYPSATLSVSSASSESASDDLETTSVGSERVSESKEDQALTQNKASTKTQEDVSTSKRSSGCKPKKSYACQYCQKVFNRPSALQTHTYTHTAEKPFQCLSPNCGRSFSVVSNLRRHFKVHQKASGSNKLSSADRFRCVKRLMQKTDAILSELKLQKRLLAMNNEYDYPLSYVQRHLISQQRQLIPANHYRHNYILPAIHTLPEENQYYGTVPSIYQKPVTPTSPQPVSEDEIISHSPLVRALQTWNDNHSAQPSLSPRERDHEAPSDVSEEDVLQFSDNISNNNNSYLLQSGLRSF